MTSVTVDTTGLDRLLKTLDGNIDDALFVIAHRIEGLAKTKAPVDTGALKNSIKATSRGAKRWIVGDGVEYGIYQELGTYRMAAQPFLIPAMLEVQGDLFNIVVEEIL